MVSRAPNLMSRWPSSDWLAVFTQLSALVADWTRFSFPSNEQTAG